MKKLTFAITDIHGRADLLETLIRKCIEFSKQNNSQPFFVFLGDYVDRGPNSKEVIALVKQTLTNYEGVALKGNHEEMLVKSIFTYAKNWLFSWTQHGYLATIKSYTDISIIKTNGFFEKIDFNSLAEVSQIKEFIDDIEFLNSLPLSYEDDLRFFVHAGIYPETPLKEQDASDMLWIRENFLNYQKLHPKHIVHGHTPNRNPELLFNRTNLDTHACHSGILTAGVFSNEKAEPIEIIDTKWEY